MEKEINQRNEVKRCVTCPLCGEPMVQKKLRGNEWWECSCGVEVWPPDERVEKQIRRTMQSAPAKKKGSGGKRRSRFKTRKPGQKFTPWYQRF